METVPILCAGATTVANKVDVTLESICLLSNTKSALHCRFPPFDEIVSRNKRPHELETRNDAGCMVLNANAKVHTR